MHDIKRLGDIQKNLQHYLEFYPNYIIVLELT